MLYLLAEYADQFGPLNLFRYLTFPDRRGGTHRVARELLARTCRHQLVEINTDERAADPRRRSRNQAPHCQAGNADDGRFPDSCSGWQSGHCCGRIWRTNMSGRHSS